MARLDAEVTETNARSRHADPKSIDALVVVSPTARRYPPEEMLETLEVALQGAGLRYRILAIPEGEARPVILREVKRALAEGCDRVVAVGGDGTISMVAEGLIRAGEPSAALGIIPAGTANVLARELGIPGKLEDAVETVVRGERTVTLDAIAIEDHFYVTQVGIGPDASMIQKTSQESQGKLGRWTYVINYIRESLRRRSRRFTIDLDGSPLRAHAWQIVLANVGSLAAPPFTWGPRIDPTDGVLNLCVYDVRTAQDYMRLVSRLVLARHIKDASTRYLRVRDSVTIRSERPSKVQADGDIVGETPVTARVVPGALRVLVRREVEAPIEPVPPATVVADGGNGAAAVPGETVAKDVETMLATEHSATWVLQGWLRHPLAALQALDAAVFLRANALLLGSFIDRGARIISSTMRYGEGWAFVLAVMIAVDFRAGLRAAVDAGPVIGLTMLTVNVVLKRIFRRRRPFISYVKARVLGTRPKDFSFPSGHAAAGFAGALALSAHAPAGAPLFYALAVVVSLSRVYLGVHYPSDILFGAFLGTLLAAIYRVIFHVVFPGLG